MRRGLYNRRMTDGTNADPYLAKTQESLAGAESEYTNARYNNCANRAYYACFQAAVAALVRAGIGPSRQGRYDHDVIQAQFVGQLINRRHRYPTELRSTLDRLFALRQVADYRTDVVSQTEANRAIRHAHAFVQAVLQ